MGTILARKVGTIFARKVFAKCFVLSDQKRILREKHFGDKKPLLVSLMAPPPTKTQTQCTCSCAFCRRRRRCPRHSHNALHLSLCPCQRRRRQRHSHMRNSPVAVPLPAAGGNNRWQQHQQQVFLCVKVADSPTHLAAGISSVLLCPSLRASNPCKELIASK